jgi:hypothetical protein
VHIKPPKPTKIEDHKAAKQRHSSLSTSHLQAMLQRLYRLTLNYLDA